MKRITIYLCFIVLTSSLFAQNSDFIVLNAPDTNRGLPVMKALSLRASVKDFDTTSINLQDMSDLLWAANGINRPENGKRTAPSALNAQDIDIFVFNKSGVYLYNANEHILETIINEDNRQIFSRQENDPVPAIICLLVSDISRFKFGEDSLRLEWAAMDAGIVTQNILIFCASVDLVSRPRAGMNKEKIKELLKLNDTQYPMLNIPVSYKKD
ncbi:MAG TPA: SagB/ThcOx family dehydrogenase [Bacteroidales bacterium]|nr:SagB/ThcOx family dehydrogenase [Bacteroidales bacterium]HRW94296.1 SagB/ThcOx family dehydrogenase [Bacteroidales bacterium]